jgi:hypothetical protein
MNTQAYIDTLFVDYQETSALADFKEELRGHLDERIEGLVKKGMSEQAAFEKAVKELGDMSVVADGISRRKRQEVISEMYMKTRSYISPKRGVLYALCGLVGGTGILIPLITWFASGVIMAALGAIIPFGLVGALGFVLLGLTQETAAREAMSLRRALWYVLAVGLVLFGVLVALITYSAMASSLEAGHAAAAAAGSTVDEPVSSPLVGAIGVLMVFVLPGVALGAYLILTERDRTKPWAVLRREEASRQANEIFANPAQAQRFGLFSGALWIAAIGTFIFLTISVGIEFSWLALVVALVAQLLLQASFTKSN